MFFVYYILEKDVYLVVYFISGIIYEMLIIILSLVMCNVVFIIYYDNIYERRIILKIEYFRFF